MAKIAAVFLISLGLSALAFGQGGKSGNSSPSTPSNGSSPSNSGGPAGAPGGGGGSFSIEAEILAYKALESDSEAIACDVAGFLITPARKISPNGPNEKPQGKSKGATFTPLTASCAGTSVDGSTSKGVVLLSASGTTLANFQAWRMNMALMKQLRIRAAAYQCPKTQPDKTLTVPILDAATEAVALVQSVLGLFANSESAAGVQGTIQDQALMDGVARHLRGLKVPVLMPDTYAPYALGGLDFKNSPFLSSLGNLMVCRVCLQALLRDPDLQVTKTDLDNLTAQRKTLSDQLEADQKEVKAGKLKGKDLEEKQTEIATLNGKIQATDDNIKKATAVLAQVNDINGLIASIDSFIGSLTGGTSPSPSGGPQGAKPDATAGNPQQNSPAPASGGVPPIATVLAADGLAQEIGVQEDGSVSSDSIWQHTLLLKALESGGSLITHSNIFGSKTFFTGGAVATYALFTMKGHLSCSGNVFDYGGYFRAKDFNSVFRNPDIDPTRQLVLLRGGCSTTE